MTRARSSGSPSRPRRRRIRLRSARPSTRSRPQTARSSALGSPDRERTSAIRDAIFKVTSKDGEVIHAGKADFAKALDLLKAGKPIRYEGVIGPVSFDQYGDITGPFRLWKIVDGKVTTIGEMSTDEVNAIKAKLGK